MLQNELRYGFDVVTDLSCLHCASTPTPTNFSIVFLFIIVLTCVQWQGRPAELCVCVCVYVCVFVCVYVWCGQIRQNLVSLRAA